MELKTPPEGWTFDEHLCAVRIGTGKIAGPEHLEELVRRANVHDELVAMLEHARTVFSLQPMPKLGEWNWPQLAKDCDAVLAKAKGGAT